MAELNWLSIQDAHAQLTSRQISSVELTQACLDRIDTVEDRVQSFLTLTPEIALSQAAEADRMLAAGEGGPLTGVPVQIKDVMCTEGVLTTCASRMLENFVPVYNATAVERLMGQGAVGRSGTCSRYQLRVLRSPSRKSVVARNPNSVSARVVSNRRLGWPFGFFVSHSIRPP